MSDAIKFIKSLLSNIPESVNGHINFTTDEGGLYIDIDDKRYRVNPQSDWEQTDPAELSYIQNKPILGTASAHDIAESLDESEDLPTSAQVYTEMHSLASEVQQAVDELCATFLKYTIIWKDAEGNVLQTDEEVPYGTTPTYNGDTPTTTLGTVEEFLFIGWNPEVDSADSDVVYVARFKDLHTDTWRYVTGNLVRFVSDEVTEIPQYGLSYEPKLQVVDFVSSESVTIGNNAFDGDTALNKLILRSESMSVLSPYAEESLNPLKDTKLWAHEGVVYVPETLLETYKADETWNDYFITSIERGMPVVQIPDTDIKVSLEMQSQAYLYFWVEIDENKDYTGASMQFTIFPSTSASQTVTMTGAVTAAGHYGYVCKLNAVQIADVITVLYHEQSGDVTFEYSLKDYLTYIVDHEEQYDQKTVAYAKSIGDFGYYNQSFLADYNDWVLGIDHTVSEPFTVFTEKDIESVKAECVEKYQSVEDNTLPENLHLRYSLTMNVTLSLNVCLVKTDGPFTTALTAKIDGEGARISRLTDQTTGVVSYWISYKNILPQDADKIHNVSFSVGGASYTIILSCLSYAAKEYIKPHGQHGIKAVTGMYYFVQNAKKYVSSEYDEIIV